MAVRAASSLVAAKGHSPDELDASVQLEGIAFESPRQLFDTLEFARKALQPQLRRAEVVPNCGRRSSRRPSDLSTLDKGITSRSGDNHG